MILSIKHGDCDFLTEAWMLLKCIVIWHITFLRTGIDPSVGGAVDTRGIVGGSVGGSVGGVIGVLLVVIIIIVIVVKVGSF